MGGLGVAVALWPLATTVWDLLGFTAGQTWRVTAVSACALLLAAGMAGMNWKRTSPVRLVWLILAAWAVATGMVAAMTTLAWLVLDTPQWKPPGELTPENLDAIATRAFAIVAGLGGVALLVIAYRRQRTTENGEQREVTKLFNERFTTAYTELGSEHAAVRLGAVHALAHLADDAPSEEEVQMVIDVLCAYLRMPYDPEPGELPVDADDAQREDHRTRTLEFASLREVRHTILRIIGNHLREPTGWRGKDYDFTGTVFDGGDLTGTHFTGGRVSFEGARFAGGTVSFFGAHFVGGKVDFSRAEFVGGTVDFTGAYLANGRVDFFRAEFVGGTVSFGGAHFVGGTMSFNGAYFTGGTMYFSGAHFVGGTMYFSGAHFVGGRVDFFQAEFTGGTVSFGGASGTCPIRLLEAIERGNPGTVLLPEEWQPTADENGQQGDPSTSPDASDH